jgi:hypothetical protein
MAIIGTGQAGPSVAGRLASAYTATYGVVIHGAVTVDLQTAQVRKAAISAQSREGLERWLKGMADCTVY